MYIYIHVRYLYKHVYIYIYVNTIYSIYRYTHILSALRMMVELERTESVGRFTRAGHVEVVGNFRNWKGNTHEV